MTQGGRIVVMPRPDVGEFLALIERDRITHTFLPPTLIYMLLEHPRLAQTRRDSLQCFWYGAAPMSTARLEEALRVIGPMAQLFGQTEAPMMVSMLPPAEHYNADGTIATRRLASAGRPAPLVTVGIMDPDSGALLAPGERGEIVVRGSLVMAGYYKNPEATEAASTHGWHHTGDIGYLDEDGYLFIVDRLKDMIITGGFNVYSAEVEQALMQHPAVRDCAVVGLPDDKWGERVTAVIEPSAEVQPDELVAFVKARIGSVKAPKQVELWQELPRSRLGKILKADVRTQLLANASRSQ
jgi:acyl-CoA synthetase (AMP-forming)/AMP-acid ligase II